MFSIERGLVCGLENFYLGYPFHQQAVVATLQRLYEQHGLEWIRENRDNLVEQSKILEMF